LEKEKSGFFRDFSSQDLCLILSLVTLRLALAVWFCFLEAFCACADDLPGTALLHRQWFEVRTANFRLFSCGTTQEVSLLGARLEQFRDAYAQLAGGQAVASPPIVVMAYPDYASLRPFLPRYQDQPANLAAFFVRGADENLIALSLTGGEGMARSLQKIYHEYAHLLFRHNDRVWPLWLKEGMADVYSSFEVVPPSTVRLGRPPPKYVSLLRETTLLPLATLFGVQPDSPEYNERDRQGLFYSQSWLLAHYFFLGDNAVARARFPQFTVLLRQGQLPLQALTNALGMSAATVEQELQKYAARSSYSTLDLKAASNLSAPRLMSTRGVPPAETGFRLGNQLLRVNQLEAAQVMFSTARRLDPGNPLPLEGLGLVAAERDDSRSAVSLLSDAVALGSRSFLAYYILARENFRLAAAGADVLPKLDPAQAKVIRGSLEESIKAMPSFGPAHHLLGVVEMVQEDPAAARAHLTQAVQLEPENGRYALSLARAQLMSKDITGARRILEGLCRPYAEPEIRSRAETLLRNIKAKGL
jgi:tetratricopeptide (TPR) repeat protein